VGVEGMHHQLRVVPHPQRSAARVLRLLPMLHVLQRCVVHPWGIWLPGACFARCGAWQRVCWLLWPAR
jgi:hypothetical protein